MSILLDLIQYNVDVSFIIFQHLDSFSALESVSAVCKASNRALNDTEQGRQVWLNLGIRTTASSSAEGFHEKQIRQRFRQLILERQEFFWHLRLLVCPWHSVGRVLPLNWRRDVNFNCESLFFVDADETLLQLQDSTTNNHQHGNNNNNSNIGMATTFPARLLSDSKKDVKSFTDQIRTAQEWVVPKLPAILDPELEQRVADKKVVPDFSHDEGCLYRYFAIHAGAFAVVESFSSSFDNGNLVDHGIYFISQWHSSSTADNNRRVVRHMKCEDIWDVSQICILSRPCEMWIWAYRSVVYYGPSCAPRSNADLASELMDEALWMAGRGDAQGAIDYLTSRGIALDHPSLISNRTILHYAAKEGCAEAVRVLLRAGFGDVDSEDDFGHTALFFAVSELHLDVVEVLLKEGNADPTAGESCLSNVGEFVQYRPYAASDDRTKEEITHIVPAIVKLLLETDAAGETLRTSEDHFTQASILSSPEAVRMLCTADEPPCLSNVCYRFGSFRNQLQEISAVQSLYILVREFDVDINHLEPPLNDLALAVLAKHAVSEAVVMMVDNLGADPRTVAEGGKTIRQIVQERVTSNPADQEGQRILDFLDARGV